MTPGDELGNAGTCGHCEEKALVLFWPKDACATCVRFLDQKADVMFLLRSICQSTDDGKAPANPFFNDARKLIESIDGETLDYSDAT